MTTQTADHETRERTIGFAVRLTQDDLDPVTRAWRFPVLELPGASLKEVYADGERVDPEKYRLVEDQLRWVPGDNLPEKLTAFVSVDSESRDEILQSRDRAKTNEDRWKKFAIIVPLITAALGAAVSLYINRAPHPSPAPKNFTLKIAPGDYDKQMPSPWISVNGMEVAAPYTGSFNADTLAVIDLSNTIGLLDALRSRDQRSREFLVKFVALLKSVDDPLANAANNIIQSCPGGAAGQTPANGPATIQLINKARGVTAELKAAADELVNEPPK